MQELLLAFVPVADEVHFLQRTPGPEGELFRKIAEQGHYAGRTQPTDTRQGIYASTADGTFLASINSADPEAMAGMLERALEKWKALPAEARDAKNDFDPAPAGRLRLEAAFPKEGAALAVYARDLPRGKNIASDWRGQAWNVDYVWFTSGEMKSLVPDGGNPGAARTVPSGLARRLACFHLVDFVRGQTLPYDRRNIERAGLTSEILSIQGDDLTIEIRGDFRTVARGKWSVNGFQDMRNPSAQERGIEGTLQGRGVFDRAAGRFRSLDAVFLGTRWGATQYNGRSDDRDPSPVGFAFRLAEDAPDHRVAPAFLWGDYWGQERHKEEKMPELEGKKVCFVIASQQFRDEEYREPRALLEKAGAKVTVASSALATSKGMLGMEVKPEVLFTQIRAADFDAVVFIGGGGATEYWTNPKAHALAKDAVAAGKILGAICFGPVTLANAGLLNGRRCAVYSSEVGQVRAQGGNVTGKEVERDGLIITGNGPTAAKAFGEALAAALSEKAGAAGK